MARWPGDFGEETRQRNQHPRRYNLIDFADGNESFFLPPFLFYFPSHLPVSFFSSVLLYPLLSNLVFGPAWMTWKIDHASPTPPYFCFLRLLFFPAHLLSPLFFAFFCFLFPRFFSGRVWTSENRESWLLFFFHFLSKYSISLASILFPVWCWTDSPASNPISSLYCSFPHLYSPLSYLLSFTPLLPYPVYELAQPVIEKRTPLQPANQKWITRPQPLSLIKLPPHCLTAQDRLYFLF